MKTSSLYVFLQEGCWSPSQVGGQDAPRKSAPYPHQAALWPFPLPWHRSEGNSELCGRVWASKPDSDETWGSLDTLSNPGACSHMDRIFCPRRCEFLLMLCIWILSSWVDRSEPGEFGGQPLVSSHHHHQVSPRSSLPSLRILHATDGIKRHPGYVPSVCRTWVSLRTESLLLSPISVSSKGPFNLRSFVLNNWKHFRKWTLIWSVTWHMLYFHGNQLKESQGNSGQKLIISNNPSHIHVNPEGCVGD